MIQNPLTKSDYAAFCSAVADAYDRAPEFDPSESWRWEVLAKHIRKFYKRMTPKIRVVFEGGQPYANASEMRKDIARGVLKISTDFNEHAVFDPETNLQFRAVHDYVVHGGSERGPDFSRRGEIRAYNKHRQIAPPDSWPALFTEVVGQACYFNTRKVFPTQKIAVLPGFDFYAVGDQAVANPAAEPWVGSSARCFEHEHPQLVEPVSEAEFRSEVAAVLRACGVVGTPKVSFPPELAARHRGDPRAYAEVLPEELVFRFAPQVRALPTPNRLGLIVHEVGHVLDPSGTESGADDASERALAALGLSLAYDSRWPGKGLQRLKGPVGTDLQHLLRLR